MGLFVGSILEYFLKAIAWSVKRILQSVRARGSGKWPQADAVITADPQRVEGLSGTTVEIVYSYRFEGELYTGFHEEPLILQDSEYEERFAKGRRFVVRVKPGEPEVSIVCDEDQADGIQKRLEEIDEVHKRKIVRNQSRSVET